MSVFWEEQIIECILYIEFIYFLEIIFSRIGNTVVSKKCPK